MISKISSMILMMLSFIFFFLSLFSLYNYVQFSFLYTLIELNSLSFNFVIYCDWVSYLFMSFVFFISSLIMKYSENYMETEKNFKRFMFLMFLFIFSMMMLIFSLSLISLLLGWDGLGLVSYALVMFYQNKKSNNAAMLTVLSNRVGDAALLMSIAWVTDMGSWDYMSMLGYLKDNSNMSLLIFLIILAAFTKSAQVPFSSWLPAAMAAPTPVSSLVHSSTLVTAGVYLLYRFSFLIPEWMMMMMMFISMITMFMAGLSANFEYDLKKIIALSTLSQLGMMMVILMLGSNNLAYFHLIIHALFKALLFLCAGAIIHSMSNCQDIRMMGGLLKSMPSTCVCLCVSNLSLCGLPFLSGFYSKDLIAENLSMSCVSIFIYFVFYLSIGLTVSYSFRLLYFLFWLNPNNFSLSSINDMNNMIMFKSMNYLIFLVIFKGTIISWLIFDIPMVMILPFSMKILTLLMIFIGSFVGYEVSKLKYNYYLKSFKKSFLIYFASQMWNLPFLSTSGINTYLLKFSKIYFMKLENGWYEFYGSKGIYKMMNNYSKFLQLFSLNHLKLLLMLIFILFIFITTLFMI